jgi:hypothetical protein
MREGESKPDPPPGQITQGELDIRFTYHPPATADDVEAYKRIRSEAREFAETLVELVPASRELSRALTHLEESVMNANAGRARRSR